VYSVPSLLTDYGLIECDFINEVEQITARFSGRLASFDGGLMDDISGDPGDFDNAKSEHKTFGQDLQDSTGFNKMKIAVDPI